MAAAELAGAPVLVSITRLGIPRLARFKTLNASARNFSVVCAVIFVVLNTVISTVFNEVPVRTLRQMLTWGPATDRVNTLACSQCSGMRRCTSLKLLTEA